MNLNPGTDQQQLDSTPQDFDALNAAANAEPDDDFEAAFNGARSEPLGTEGPTSSTTSQAPAAAAGTTSTQGEGNTDEEDLEDTGTPPAQPAPAAAGTQAEDDLDAPVTITKRQLADLTGLRDTVMTLQGDLRKSVESVNGRFGSIQQTLKEVREQASKGIRPSFDQMEALEEDFPELASVLKRDLGRIFGAGNETEPGTGGDTASGDSPGAAQPVNPLEAPEVRAALRDAQLAIVEAHHPGWRQLPASADWQAWHKELPATAQHVLATATDAATLNDALADFKDWQQKRAAATTTSNQRDKRLEHAVPATTGKATVHRAEPSDDEQFDAGFQSVAGRR